MASSQRRLGSSWQRALRQQNVEVWEPPWPWSHGAYSPHINGGGVLGRPQQHIRGPVPQGHHLIGVGLRGH